MWLMPSNAEQALGLDVVWLQRSAGGTENTVIFQGPEVKGKV